jgi:lon-related putative ATP-dependent protease
MIFNGKLKPEEVLKKCDPKIFEFETTEEVPPLEGIIGQERAVKAMDFGLKIKRHGYNIFMTGLTGTGKISYARSVISSFAQEEPVPDDWCYLYNFKNPDQPLTLNLPAGMGKIFVRDIHNLLEELKGEIPKTFNTEEYERQKGAIVKQFQEIRSALMEELNKAAQKKGFILKRTGTTFLSVPLKEGKELSEDDFNQLGQPEREEMERRSTEIQLKAMEIVRRIQNEEKNMKSQFKELDHKTVLNAIGHHIDELKEKYKGFAKVVDYLGAFRDDILGNLNEFKDDEEDKQIQLSFFRFYGRDAAAKYSVNLIIDNSETRGAPVVVESNPTYYNLIGRVEHENRLGMVTTDFTMIKGGALHRANGGYLILQAKDVLLNFQAWEVLKRVLTTKEVRIETIGEQYALLTMATLKPEPIPLEVKIVLIGNPVLYHLLYRYDEDFRKLFKIKADFDVVMERSLDNMSKMASFISSHCEREQLKHFDRTGTARMVDYSSRLAEHQGKLSTCFNDIVEIMYEADAWAVLNGSDYIKSEHVEHAISEKNYRSDKYEKKLLEQINEGQILLDFKGEKKGQVNALAIIDLGDYVFARPSRITASVYPGRRGIVNIERESKMSGRIHDKGILIISGYLGQKYARNMPLTLTAGLCFEQSYEGVEGDSASSAELFALLSSLADVPLKQGIAVTGSVNQKGELQPVGGITRKIEGFFAACKLGGLTGEQGVLIPSQNVVNLMLSQEVVDSLREEKFHIYAIKTIDEGLEILTGIPAGQQGEDGKYPEGTVNYLVRERLKEYNDRLAKQSNGQEKAEERGQQGYEI